MYAVGINNDNTVTTLVNQRIYQGYRLSDWFWFFTNPNYNGNNMREYSSEIQFILPVSKKIFIENIILKNELYEGSLKYSLSSKSKLTNEPGLVSVKVIFKDLSGNIIRETSEFTVKISTTDNWHNDIDINSPDSSEEDNTGCNCDSEEYMNKIISKTKPLMFTSVSDAETKLNSGEIKGVYYGQSIIIDQDGKYIPYTVQSGTNGYTIEPVDNNTECDGVEWQEDV